jgi:DNA-directed RNA polymerase subunit RPC12/RpoP
MSDCQHSLCSLCGERLWDNRKQQIECPSCKDISSVVMIRDRMFFDAERKSKMFGIYKKKLDAKRQKMQQMQGRQSRSSAGYRSSPGSRKNSSSAEPHLNPQSFTAAGSSKQRSISSSQPRKH